MRVLAFVAALAAAPATAAAGELYMGLSAGGAPALDGRLGEHFHDEGHLAFGYVFGGVIGGVQMDMVMFGAGYTTASVPTSDDAAMLVFGADLGKRLPITERFMASVKVGLHAAVFVPFATEDVVPDPLVLGGFGVSYGVEAAYRLGRVRSRAPTGPIRFLVSDLVLDARRERLRLENDDGDDFWGSATVVMLGLRFGAEL